VLGQEGLIDFVNRKAYFIYKRKFMTQTNVNIRMDTQLKEQFETFCNNVGLTMSIAFNIFAKTSVKLQKIPFEITAEHQPSLSQTGEDSPLAPFYSESNMKVLMKSIRQLKKGKGVEHELIGA
jgi:DNA-damage-inducible protein J